MRRAWLSILCVPAIVFATANWAWCAPDDPQGKSDLPAVGRLLDRLVPELLAKGNFPGAAVAVVSGSKTVFARGYGLADVDLKTPVTPETGFYVGSTAKLFTAAAVLQLVDDKKLKLDVDVNRYLTDVRIRDTYPGHPVTLQHLLTHTAGFDPDYAMVGTSSNDSRHLPSLAESIAAHQPARVRPPGSVLSYDNYGVALAGLVVEEASGVPYARYIDQHIYAPLTMVGATASQPHSTAVEHSLATGYRPQGTDQTPAGATANPFSPSGPGQVTTADDMARFMVDQLSEKSALGHRIPQRMQREHFVQDPRIPGIGYIYESQVHGGVRVLMKTGDTSGFHNAMYLLPKKGVGLFLAVNGDGNGESDPSSVLDAVVDHYFPEGPASRPRPIGDHEVSAYAGRYQSSRTSHHSVVRLRALSQSLVTVTANSDGTVTTTGRTLATDSEASSQRWVQIDKGLFREINGPAMIAFDDHGVLAASRATNQAYLRVAWYENPALHLRLALAGLAGLLIGLVAIPITALTRRKQGKPQHSAGARAARLLAWTTAAFATCGMIAFALLIGDPAAVAEKLFLGSPELYAAMIAMSLVVLCTLVMCVAEVAAWRFAWWGRKGRVGYALLTVCAVALSAVASMYNVIGPPID